MIRSKDIAKIAGVSRSTVSRVINNYPNVPPETYKKVMDVIKKYNYKPNLSARVLVGKKNNTIGIFVVSLTPFQNSIFKLNLFQNNYFGPFVDALIDISNSSGFYSLVNIAYKKEDVERIIEIFAEMRIDGGILIGMDRKDPMILEIARLGLPFVVVHYDENYLLNNVENASFGIINTLDYEAGVEATEYLISMGHRNIAFLNGRLTNYSAFERFRGYLQAMKNHNLPLKKEFILHGKYLRHLTEIEIKKVVESKELPSAIICCNDDMALITMNLLRELKIRIPEDISIISFDNVPLSEYTQPGLTTFNMPIYEIAEKSFTTLQKLLTLKKSSSHTFFYELPMTLVERGSVLKIKYTEKF